ncbi:hypothetical protein ACFX2I_038644 [Malus domestica]
MLRLICLKLKQKASPYLLSRHGSLYSTSTAKPTSKFSNFTDPQLFTASYLQKSCGLSSDSAISASKKLQIEPTATHHPDSVLSLFRAHGLTRSHIKNLITKRPGLLLGDLDSSIGPNLDLFKSLGFSGTSLAKMVGKEPRVLECNAKTVFEFFRSHGLSEKDIASLMMKLPALFVYDAEKIFKPKIEFFRSLGLSEIEIATILSNEPYVLTRSLKHHFIPSVKALRQFLGSDENVLKAIKGYYRMLECNLEKLLEPNITLLRSHGVPESLIVKIFMIQPKTLLLRNAVLSEIIDYVKDLGFEPNNLLFVLAVRSMAVISTALWEQKLETYTSLGLSKDEIFAAFRSQPMCMITSVKKIHQLMDFFVNKLNLKPSTVAKHPNLLLLSMEKRILPRCSVLQLLLSQGLIKEDINFPYVLKLTEKAFMRKVMSKYEQVVPDIVKANKGQIEFQGFPVPVICK